MVLVGGRIVTIDDNRPEAQALAIRDDRILSVGTDAEIRPLIGGNTTVINLEGKLAVPGFIESHAHFMSLGKSLMRLRLGDAANYEEIIEMVARAVKETQSGEWIMGRGWHQEKWDRLPVPNVVGLPFHQALSEVSPDNPVLLKHASGHSSLVNAKAMELVGITKGSEDPEGGEIVRDADGNPIGVFREKAQKPFEEAQRSFEENRTAEERAANERRAAELAIQECLSKGITSFHDAGATLEEIELYKELVVENALGIRLWVMIGEPCLRISPNSRLSEWETIG
jgi:predicted amidohydrolase YtcJ